jgi:hypothetical protein
MYEPEEDNSSEAIPATQPFQTGARVSEFSNSKVEHFFFDELMILIDKGKGGRAATCRSFLS